MKKLRVESVTKHKYACVACREKVRAVGKGSLQLQAEGETRTHNFIQHKHTYTNTHEGVDETA